MVPEAEVWWVDTSWGGHIPAVVGEGRPHCLVPEAERRGVVGRYQLWCHHRMVGQGGHKV